MNLTKTMNDATIYKHERSVMTTLQLILGIASIFSSGVLAQVYSSKKDERDFYMSIIGFASGVFILISMIGTLV